MLELKRLVETDGFISLMKENGLSSILLVKTAHKKYPKCMLDQHSIKRGEWKALSGTVDGIPLLAVRFKDLQVKQFISTCSTRLPGEPRKTKHSGDVQRPQVAERYVKHSAAVDFQNHLSTAGLGLEDAWMTKNYIHRQFAGVLGFVFTNAYLAKKFFFPERNSSMYGVVGEHTKFKMSLCNQLMEFANNITRLPNEIKGMLLHFIGMTNSKTHQEN